MATKKFLAEFQANEKVLPFYWPWKGLNQKSLSSIDIISTRSFSVFYLFASWAIVGFLGFASNRDCDSNWKIQLLCEQAIWLGQFKSDPIHFSYNLLSSAWVHNGFMHLSFVTFFGVLIIIQSFELQYGTKATAFIFIASNILIGLLFALIFNTALFFWPDSHFVNYGFERNWMGGSVGFYSLIGAFVQLNNKLYYLLLAIVAFETFNFFILGTSLHISLIHITSLAIGYMVASIKKA